MPNSICTKDFPAFAGSAPERAAALRADPAAMAARLLLPGTLVLPVWRGQPLIVQGSAGLRLGLLPAGHPALAGPDAPVFIALSADGGGSDPQAARFAQDISGWEPSTDQAGSAGVFATEGQGHPALSAEWRFRELRQVMDALAPEDAAIAATAKALLGWHRSHIFCATCGAKTGIEASGWQRACPACGTKHFPRTDPVVIMLITRGNEALLGRSPGWDAGMYSCLAGFIEPGETAEAAVRREVFEEAGVRVGSVRYVTSQPWPFPSSLMLGFAGTVDADDPATRLITLDPVELEDARWVTREELSVVASGARPDMHMPRHGSIAAHLMRLWLEGRLG